MNSWFAEAVEGVRYFSEMLQDMLFTLQKKASR